ncbi:hypothetical protein ACHAP5_005849 [Fusarium lateritium]
MAALWDPEHLLQITHGIRDRCGKVNCFGTAKHNMSQTPPESITTETLRYLARLCLCSSYHSHQSEIFVSDWQTVINATVQCNKRIIQAQAGDAKSQLSLRTAEAVHLKENLATLRHQYAALQSRLDLISTDSDEKIAKLNKHVQDCEAERADTNNTLSEMESSLQAWMDKAAEESESRTEVEEENAVLRVRLEKVDGQLREFESVKRENTKLEEQIALLAEQFRGAERAVEDGVKKAKDIEQQRADERALAQSMMHQYQTQLDQERSNRAVLKGRIGGLESVVTELQDDILSCWSHRFWGWMARVGKGSSTKLRMGSQNESAKEIALKTYA